MTKFYWHLESSTHLQCTNWTGSTFSLFTDLLYQVEDMSWQEHWRICEDLQTRVRHTEDTVIASAYKECCHFQMGTQLPNLAARVHRSEPLVAPHQEVSYYY